MALGDYSLGPAAAPSFNSTFNSMNPGDLAAPDSVYAEYMRANRAVLDATATSVWSAGAPERPASPYDEAPGSYALQTFDPDPFGLDAQKAARQSGRSVDSNYVGSLVVAGKRMSREELEATEDGRAILAEAIRRREGHKRGFLESVMDLGITDLPFFGLAATVGGSISDARMVGDIMRKAQAGEEITDEERLKLGRWSYENSRESTVGGMIGDIVRAAPGFMFEFAATGGLLSGVRAGAARAVGESSVSAASALAVNRGTKILAGELAEQAVRESAAKLVAAGAARAETAAAVRGLGAEAAEEMAKRVSTSIYGFVAETMGRSAPKTGALAKAAYAVEGVGKYSDEFIQAVSDNIARKAVSSATARLGASSAFSEWAIGAAQSARGYAARALLDFGTWGTETSTTLYTGLGTVRGALADALGASVVEAPIRGALMYLPNRLVAQPLIGLATGGVVSQSQLSLQASALRTGDRDLMDMSGVIAEGMNLLEYVSENAGRGFNSGLRAAGLATGLAKPAERALVGGVGEILRADAKVEVGGILRKAIRRALGTTEQYAARTADTQAKAISRYLARNGVEMSDDAVRVMIRSRSVPEAAAAVVGGDFDVLAKRAVKEAMKDEATELSYKSYFRYWAADFMARNNFGPEQTLNAFQRMGYDGILGEMYEERYSDFMKGLCGLDDQETHSFRENVGRAFRNIYPEEGWRQLVAEAVGFAVPAVTRAAVLNVQRVLGGGSELDRARAAGRAYRDAVIGMSVYEDRVGTFMSVMDERKSGYEDDLAKAERELAERRRMLAEQRITDPATVENLVKEQSAKVADAREALERHGQYVADTLKANGIKEVSEDIAGKLMRFAVLPTVSMGGRFADKIKVRYSSEQLAEAKLAQDALLADAAFLGAAYDKSRQYGLGERDIGMWRKIAAKTVGIAGALVCGEPALAQSNAARWASVDEGLDPRIAEDLGNMHREYREKAERELREANAAQEPTEAEVDAAVAKTDYGDRARDYVRSQMLLAGARMFAHSEMLDRAAIHLAGKRGLYFDAKAREFVEATPSASPKRVPFRQFLDENRKEAESLRDDIGREVLRILTDGDTRLLAAEDQYLSYINLKPGDPSAVPTARALAARMSGFGHLVQTRQLAPGVPVEVQLAADATTVSEELVKAVAERLEADPTGASVPAELVEHLARDLQYPGATTDEALAKRRQDIFEVVRAASGALTGDVLVFQRHVDVGESRTSDDAVRTVTFTRNPATRLWSTTDEVRDGKTNAYAATWEGDDERLRELVDSNSLVRTTRRIVLTPARALVTDDPVLMLQKVGGGEELVRASRVRVEGGYDYSRVHPMLRLNDQTHQPLHTRAEAEDVLRREAFMAEFAGTHASVSDYNFEKAPWTPEVEKLCVARRAEYMRMRENVVGENGYLTLINRSLTAQGVECPGADTLLRSALGRSARGMYSIGLAQYSARHRSADHYVSVDYEHGIDPVSGIVFSAVADGLRRLMPRLGNVTRSAVRTFFRDLDGLVEKAVFDTRFDRETREALSRFRDAVTRAYESPSARSVATVAAALCCGQVERAAARGHAATVHDAAIRAIADEARSLGSYVEFYSAVDLFLGGTGFEDLRAVRDAGGDASKLPPSGVMRIIGLTGADPRLSSKPAGMDWDTFESEVNRYAAQTFKDAPAPKPRAGSDSSGADYSRLRSIFANAGFDTVAQVSGFLRRIGKVEPFAGSGDKVVKMNRSLTNLESRVSGLDTQIASLEAEVARLGKELADKQSAGADVGEEQEKIDARQDELNEAKKVRRDLTSRIADVSAAVKAGRSEAPVVPVPDKVLAPPKADEDDEFGEGAETLDSVDVADREAADTPTRLVFAEDGTVTVVSEETSSDDFDAGQKETTIVAALGAVRAVDGPGPVSEARFREMLREFTDGSLPEETIDALWTYYDLNRGNALFGEAPLDDVDDGSRDDGEDEGAHSADHSQGDKYAKAFSNKQLDRYLAFYRYVSPQNGREFQAGVNGIRDNIEMMKEGIEELRRAGVDDDPVLVATVRMLDALFNSEAVVADGVNGHADREALFTSRVMALEDGSEGVTLDQMIAKLLEHTAYGRPRFRQAAFFLSYLRSMAPEDRRRFMTLACCSVAAKKISMRPTDDGLTYTLCRDNGRYSSVSAFAAVGSFTGLLRMKAEDVRRLARDIEARVDERDPENQNVRVHPFDSPHVGRRLRVVADVLAPALGQEAPILQAITSPHMLDALRRNYGSRGPDGVSKALRALADGSTLYAASGSTLDKAQYYGGMPPMVKSVVDVLDAYANSVRDGASDAEKRRLLSGVVVTEFAMGLSTSSAREGNKDMSVTTPWAWALGAYTTGLPETVATANTIPERNPKIASKVAVSLQDAPPVVRQFMDKPVGDDTGFAYHAFRVWLNNEAPDQGAELRRSGMSEADLLRHFEEKVLPQCRQRLVWPNVTRSEVLAKCIDRDYTADERLEACAHWFAEGWYYPEARKAAAGPADFLDEPAPQSAATWFVPVYNGDHSAGVIMQIPTEVIYNGVAPNFGELAARLAPAGSGEGAGPKVYKRLADMVNTWLGFDAFGNDSKRSSLACSEFAGRSMRGVKYVDGKLVKGETRVHVVHNYAMEGHNDAFLGTTLATGYGLRVQQDVAKDKNTLTHKLHVMSGTGTDLTMLKSLVTAMWEYTGRREPGSDVDPARVRGKFVGGMATQALMDYIIRFRKARGDSDVSTSMLVDEDSVKVGVLNSKTMGHFTGEKDGKAEFEPLMRYVFRAIEAAGGTKGTLKGEALDKALCDVRADGAPVADADGAYRFWWVESSGERVRRTVGELLGTEEVPDGGVEVNVVDGLSGKALDFSYADNSLMSYAVANVSHRSKPNVGSMPRNNALDGLTMGMGLRRAGLLDGAGTVDDAMSAIAAWGVLASAVGTDWSRFEYARSTGTCAEKVRNGADPNGSEVREQATRDVYKKLTTEIKPPLFKIDAPLVSSGAVYHEFSEEELAARAKAGLPRAVGEVRDHTADPFLRRMHLGSRVYSRAEAALRGTSRSLGLAHVNVSLENTGFRYGWFVNEDALDDVYKEVVGVETTVVDGVPKVVGPAEKLADDPRYGAWAKARPALAMVERIFEEVARCDRLNAEAVEAYNRAPDAERDAARERARDARKAARAKRDALMKLFRDHHGLPLSGYWRNDKSAYAYQVCFDDLFVTRADGTRGFDRSALEEGVPDPDSFGDVKGLWLAGTTFGLPRTPSYNGSMWCQTVRASTPCTEVLVRKSEAEGGGDAYEPGADAMVMPDPQTLKILGCDHDGDKTACYMYRVDMRTGTAGFVDPDDITPAALKDGDRGRSVFEFTEDPLLKKGYVSDMVAKGYVREGRRTVDPETGNAVSEGLAVSGSLRNRVSNTIVRGYFDMSRRLAVDAGDSAKDFYGTPMARATKAQPLDIVAGENDPRWKQLKARSLEAFDFLRKSRIGDSVTGGHVSTSAGIADKARGSIVSWAGVLHLAQFSGRFDRLFHFTGDGAERFMKWVRFMYGVDGVSNATFDDIKEQICLRLGWTSGMMDTFIADMMFDADETGRLREPPTSSDEFFERIGKYVDSVAQHGSRFWMMVAAEPSDSPYPVFGDRSTRSIHDDLRAMFGARPGSRVTAQAVCGTLGIIRSGDGRRLSLAEDRAHDKVLLPFVRALLVQARRQGVASMPKEGAKPDDVEHYLLSQLVGDVSSRGGYNAGIGYLFSVRRDILDGSDVDALAADYLRWSNAQRLLREARDFSRAVNFMKADPGSGALMGRRDDMARTFRDVMKDADASEASRLLALMYAANMTAYTADDMGTMQGRSTLATNVRDSAIGRWAAEQRGSSRPAVHRVIERLWAEQAIPPNMLMQLEGNRMTVDYLLAALVSTPKAAEGTDLMSGDRGLAAWRTMETMARAATAVPGEAGGPPVSEGDATSTLGFHRAFMALWGALYGLVSTSAQAKDFSALAYVRSTDAGFGGETAKGSAKYAYGQGLERLSCMFNDKDGASQQLLWDATDRILRGDLDPSRQRRVTNNRAADATHATTFVLSASNLREFLKEMGPRQKGERSALRRRVELAIRVLDAMSALNGGKEVEITPRTLLEQYFPIYATASARTSTPNPKSNSVVNVVRGLYARLSKLQALFDSGVLERGMNLPAGYRLMDMVDSTDLAVPLLPALAGGHLASLSGLSKEQLSQVIEELADSEQRDGTYAYEDNDALNGLLALVRGKDDTGAPRRDRVRGNPRNRHVVGFLEGTQLLRAVHEYIAETLSDAAREAPAGTPAEANEHDPEAEEAAVAADPGEKDPDVQRLADFYQNCLGTWADVEYKGGDLIVIRSRGGLKGSAATMFAGAMFQSRHGEKQGNPLLLRTDAVIQVRVGGQKDRNVTADVNSPAFAASFCNALRGADGKELVSADDYLRLTRAEREWLVNAYAPGSVRDGVANFSLAKPTWSISEDGVALLCGQIHLADTKSHRKALHEYFHSMVGMFRTMGVFGEADVKALAAKYGKAPRGSGMLFNEEKAADDFAKFVDGATRGAVPAESEADGKTVSIFRRILDLLKSLLNVMKFKYGFEYKSGYLADDEHNVLFGMVLHGYAIQSTSRLRERGVAAATEETAAGLADRIRFTQGLMRTVDSDSAFDSREVTSGSEEWSGDANAQEEATAKSARTRMYRAHEAKDPMEGYAGHKDPETARFETGLHNALRAELERRAPRKTAVRELVTMLSAIRTGGNGKAFDRFRYRDAAVYMAADADGWLDGAEDGAPSAEDLEQMAKDLAPVEGVPAPARDVTPGVTKEDVEMLGAAPGGRRADTPEAALAEMTLEQKRQAEEQAKERLRKWREEQGKKPAEKQPTSEDVKEAGKARLDSVEEREPDLPEGVAEPLAKFESALEMADRYDPVDRGRRPGVVAGPQRELRAVVAAARGTAAEMDAADLEILSGKKVVHNVYEQLHEAVLARREVDKRRLRHAVHAREMATAAAGQLTRITGDDYSNPNTVNVLIHLYDSGYFKDAAGRTSRQRGRAVYGTRMGASGGDAVTHAAKYASAASMAGAVLAAGGQRFGNVVDRAIREIRALAPLSNGVTTMMIRHVLAQLESVSAAADPTRVLEDSREWNAVLDSAAMNLFTGVKRGEYDSTTHDFGDYVPADSESELAERNRALYQFTKRAPGEPAEETDARTLRQKVLRMAADALFATAAQVKFMREFGLGEGSIHHDGWTGKVTRSPAEFTEMTQAFGIGAKTLAADSPLVERWNEPVFVAANLDEWYSGTVRETFGSLPVRDMMLQASRRVRGEMSTLVRKVNFLSMKWGVNRAEGRKLLKYKRFEATHEMRPGEFIKAVKDKRYVEGFSNEHGFAGETIDAALTEDQVRDVQLLHTYATALLRGDDKLVTGVDKISFLPGDFLRYTDDDPFGDGIVRSSRPLAEDDLSPEALARRYDLLNRLPESQEAARSSDFREMTSLELALWRLGMQWHSSVTGVPYKGSAVPKGSIDLYHRFARAALDAAKEVMARHGGSVEHPPKGLDSAVFNHEVLRILEAKGLVVATSADDSKVGEDGAPLLTEAVICIQGSDIDRMWEASSARELLVESRLIDGTDEERELRRREFTAKALADDLGESVVEFKRAVRDMPWITRGEGRYLTSLDTMIPEFEGGGTFTYHANRLERDRPRDQRVRLARHEMTWRNMLSDLQLSGKNFEQLTGQQLRMIHDYFGTPETGAELMAAFKAGKYARGTAASVRTGLEVNLPNDAPDATTGILGTMLSDVCSQIYRKQLERRLLMLEGRLQSDFETEDSIGRMLHEYEQASESGLPVATGNGLNATQLYRLHGKLPVNFTIGHALVSLTRGVQNALYFQSTLTSMLFTPDAEGDPLYFANPDRFNAANGCIPDATWRAAAQWWASRLGPSVKYDIAKSGVENARAIYEMVQSAGKKDGATYANFRRGAKRYASLGQDDLADAPSIAGFMAQLGEDDSGMVNRWGSARGLFSLDGSEALGYARHLFQTARLRGGHLKWLNRVMSWSKSMSVAYSVFFPIATKWESPAAAVGALATMGSNWSPELVRKHGKALSKVQQFFTLGAKEGWLDENFLGFKDVIRMMDTDDPFLNDLVMWAEAIGVSMTDRLSNVMEPDKGIVVQDIKTMAAWIRRTFGDKAGANFEGMADALFLRQGEKAFTYALNATKLAVAAQVALRLKAEATRLGKAFDPIRDMRGYAEYVDSEVGGVNPLRYAWAHPQMRSVLNKMWFSWEWTRTAWEAAGGGLVEEILFGGHTISRGQKNVTLGRWLRMYGAVMIGFPFLLQLSSKFLANALAWAFGLPPDPDDDRDKWFTWENDSKIGLSAANITPLLRLVSRVDDAYLGGNLRDWKLRGQKGTGLAGAVTGGLLGMSRGGLSGAALGAGAGAVAGAVAPGLLPEYTGTDSFNTNRSRQYFAHGGKQGWEVTRWFTDPFSQFVSKLSMPLQKLIEGVVGFSLSNPDFRRPMSDKSLPERWLDVLSPDSAWANLLGMFRPFTMGGWSTYGDAGVISCAAPVQMGSSASSLIERGAKELNAWARNDRGNYAKGRRGRGKVIHHAQDVVGDLYADARAAGIVDFNRDIMTPVLAKVVPGLYRELFNALPSRPDGHFDRREVERVVRALHRIGVTFEGMTKSIMLRYEKAGNTWRKAGPDFRRKVMGILREAEYRPFGPSDYTRENPAKRDY